MGANTIIVLPYNVRARDVATVIGVAAGMPTQWDEKGRWIKNDVVVEHGVSYDTVKILFDGRYGLYFFETSDHEGRVFYPGSSAFWSLIGKRLVDVFGGSVVYNDCDENDGKIPNYSKPWRSFAENCPRGDEPWMDLQNRMLNVPRISADEMASFKGAGSDNYDYTYDGEGLMVRQGRKYKRAA